MPGGGGGGGGGNPFTYRSPEDLAKLMKDTEDKTAVKAFETELGGVLSDLLSNANSRDIELVDQRLGEIKEALNGPLEASIDSLFGGSVAKHTYVDGLSDIDSLLILNDTSLEGKTPAEAIARVAKLVRENLGDTAEITSGKLAVTVTYPDGMMVQVLPAFRQREGLRVPSFRHDGWSGIAPEAFQNALSTRNAECGGKLVPTIKLAKSVIGELPESQRLSGYHVESLAIEAFKDYKGPKTLAAMLPIFFERSKELINRPIRDRTGQSVHVDDYMGPPNSEQRLAASHILGRIAKRMRNASAHQSKDQWSAILGTENE